MGVEKKVYSFRFEEELMNDIRKIAEEQNRSLSNFVETTLKNHVKIYLAENSNAEKSKK